MMKDSNNKEVRRKKPEIELSIVEKYILMLLYAHGGKCKGELWFHIEMFELAKVFKDLAEALDFNHANP